MMALAKTSEKTNIILDALNGIQHLVSFNAVNEDDMDSISQAFLAQANSESFDVVLKILQIFSILMNPSFDIRCDTMSRVNIYIYIYLYFILCIVIHSIV